jgi:nicotinamide-nucleotide amidase
MLSLCEEIVSILKEKNLTLSCAESCTGGLIAKSITDVSGCSSVFYGGVVSYDNSVKMNTGS